MSFYTVGYSRPNYHQPSPKFSSAGSTAGESSDFGSITLDDITQISPTATTQAAFDRYVKNIRQGGTPQGRKFTFGDFIRSNQLVLQNISRLAATIKYDKNSNRLFVEAGDTPVRIIGTNKQLKAPDEQTLEVGDTLLIPKTATNRANNKWEAYAFPIT